MNVPHESGQLDSILNALANTKRRGIIHQLSLRPATTSQLAKQHDLSLPAIHKHLQQLEDSSLIIRKKSGRTNFVALNPATLGLAQAWITQYQTGWGSPQASLDNYISSLQS